jgi:phosphogluconate dehydratase
MDIDGRLQQITNRIRSRSAATRTSYLERLERAATVGPRRRLADCSNLAHVIAGADEVDKPGLKGLRIPSVGIVTAYNDMLSAHRPYESYPRTLREAAREVGGVAQVAGGVPAMCDGVTQGETGMELSLFSRDVIARATAIALSHDVFDAALLLGICDKIVPGLLIGALSFGHLPMVFVPGGPMPSGLSNSEKRRARERYAAGEISKEELLEAESRSYHSAGTCTFYGTANSNQMFMELMGLQLPGSSFENPGSRLRHAFTRTAARRAVEMARGGAELGIGRLVDERAIVNAMVGLLATGGSTNHTIHLVAIARAAGIVIDWDDFDALSAIVPTLARVYPNGQGDVNDFHQAGGLAFLIGALLDAGLLHGDIPTVLGAGLEAYRGRAVLAADDLVEWADDVAASLDPTLLRSASEPFDPSGGMRLVTGNLGRAIAKTSAVAGSKRRVAAPALVFDDQHEVARAFAEGRLDRDGVVVVRFQGPRANGMPELHKLMPVLGLVLDRGHRVALVTDGRLSGASGKVSSAIHVHPEAAVGGPLAKLRDGDLVVVDPDAGLLRVDVPDAEWAAREPLPCPSDPLHFGLGRELFTAERSWARSAEEGATTFGWS